MPPNLEVFFVVASSSQEAQEKEDMHVCTGDVVQEKLTYFLSK